MRWMLTLKANMEIGNISKSQSFFSTARWTSINNISHTKGKSERGRKSLYFVHTFKLVGIIRMGLLGLPLKIVEACLSSTIYMGIHTPRTHGHTTLNSFEPQCRQQREWPSRFITGQAETTVWVFIWLLNADRSNQFMKNKDKYLLLFSHL